MTEKILLVDDDASILSAYQRFLSKKFKVVTAKSGKKGLAALKEQGPFAVIVSDYRMPEMDGVQFLQLACQIAPDTVRIMLTGHASMEGAIGAINEGRTFRFLTKPCPGNILMETVLTAVEHYKLKIARHELLGGTLVQQCLQEFKISVEKKLQKMAGKMDDTFQNMIRAMDVLMERKDPHTARHQRNVALLAAALAEKMELTEEQTKGLQAAAAVHDIGKIYIPAEILNKPGELSEAEFSLVKNHPQAGYEILKTINFPWPVEEMVLQHHERLDGSGYPQGLKGEEILLTARILSVADVIEAMSSCRPYKRAFGLNSVLDEILQNAGTLYDEEVVDACLKLFKVR